MQFFFYWSFPLVVATHITCYMLMVMMILTEEMNRNMSYYTSISLLAGDCTSMIFLVFNDPSTSFQNWILCEIIPISPAESNLHQNETYSNWLCVKCKLNFRHVKTYNSGRIIDIFKVVSRRKLLFNTISLIFESPQHSYYWQVYCSHYTM